MNNLGIQNNRFHQQAVQNRRKSSGINHMKKKRNQLDEKQQKNELDSSTDSCLDIVSPNLAYARIPNSFSVKLIKDINNQQRQLQY